MFILRARPLKIPSYWPSYHMHRFKSFSWGWGAGRGSEPTFGTFILWIKEVLIFRGGGAVGLHSFPRFALDHHQALRKGIGFKHAGLNN